jgi:hypothetical protein
LCVCVLRTRHAITKTKNTCVCVSSCFILFSYLYIMYKSTSVFFSRLCGTLYLLNYLRFFCKSLLIIVQRIEDCTVYCVIRLTKHVPSVNRSTEMNPWRHLLDMYKLIFFYKKYDFTARPKSGICFIRSIMIIL